MTLTVKSESGSTHYDMDFKQHLKVIKNNLYYLQDGLWLRSAHREGVYAIDYEKAIVEIK